MSNSKKWAVFLLWALFFSGQTMAEKPKMATVDMQKLFKEYHRTVTAQEHFNAELANIQKAINEKNEVVKKKRRMIEAITEELKNENITDEEKASKQRDGQLIAQEMKIAQRHIDNFTRLERGKVAQKKAASMKGIMIDIKQKVVTLSEKMGYDYVFDRSGLNTNQVTFFLYLKDATDITATMLKELNKFAPGADSE